jgi:hypothetical protein
MLSTGRYGSSRSLFTVLQLYNLTVEKRLKLVYKNGKGEIYYQFPFTSVY